MRTSALLSLTFIGIAGNECYNPQFTDAGSPTHSLNPFDHPNLDPALEMIFGSSLTCRHWCPPWPLMPSQVPFSHLPSTEACKPHSISGPKPLDLYLSISLACPVPTTALHTSWTWILKAGTWSQADLGAKAHSTALGSLQPYYCYNKTVSTYIGNVSLVSLFF